MDQEDLAAATQREELLGTPQCGLSIPERDAWSIALTWCDALNNSPQLKTESIRSDPFAVVKSYAWIKIKIDSAEDAARARAATLAWFWLASCRGYSAQENPRFWKRVFASRQHDSTSHVGSSRDGSLVTDATRFFDAPHAFPSIRVQASDADVGRVFYCGSSVASNAARIASQLASIQERLRPHMRVRRLARCLPVRMELKLLSQVPRLLVMLSEPFAVRSPDDPITRSPVESVLVHAWVSYLDQATSLLLTDRRLVIKTLELTPKDPLDARANLRPLFQVTTNAASTTRTGARVQTLCLRRESLSEVLLPMVCSALPHSQTFSVLRIMAPTPGQTYRPRNRGCRIKDLQLRPFHAMDWAWLGYALFHPDTIDAAWHALEMNVDSITPDATRVLQLMAQGNNLAMVEDASQSQICDSYDTVQIRPRTTVYSLPTLDANVLYETTATVTACECVHANASNAVADWIRIVAPGYGFGWVQAWSVTASSSRPSSGACLRGLRLHATVSSEISTALEFTALVGTNLQQLDLSHCGPLDVSQLHGLLTALPALKSLTMQQDSTLWSASLPRACTFRLEELCMTLGDATLRVPSPTAFKTVLSELRALRCITPSPSFLENNRSAALAYINTLPNLTYFHWSERRREHNYHHDRITTQRKLGGHVTAMHMARCRLAFLSVHHTVRLDEGVCALIFSFMPEFCPVDLWIGV